MKICCPLWSEGAFLTPQQFQQQTRWDAHVADIVAHISFPSPWDVISVKFDESTSMVSRLNPVNLVMRFSNSTLVDAGILDNLPLACDLSHLTGYNNVDTVLALSLLSANDGNLSSGNSVSRPCRWQQEWLPVQDLSGQERTDMAVLRHAVTLRYAHDDNSVYLTCLVICLIRNAQRQWELKCDFLPPSLPLSASPLLINSLNDLVHRVQARCCRLMSLRRENNERVADFTTADVSLFWLLNTLNSLGPVLKETLQDPGRHPELLWRGLARLADSLLTFSLGSDVSTTLPYQHADPQQVFLPLFALLAELLEASPLSHVVVIGLTQERQFWYGALSNARLHEGADFHLSVRLGLPAYVPLTQFPQLCKTGSWVDVPDIVNVVFSGTPLKPLTYIPAATPLRLENQYFALEINHPVAQAMLDTGNCVFYMPGTLREI